MFLKTISVIFELSVILFIIAKCDSQEIRSNFRLPNNSYPLKYDLSLRVNLENKSTLFNGRIKIHIQIKEASDSVTLHSKDLTIRKIILTDLSSMTKYESVPYKLIDIGNLLVITLPYSMPIDSEILLDIQYHGYMTEADGDVVTNRGLVIASYSDSNNITENYIYTDFEATKARQCMPCYDEPAIRAPFSLQIEHHSAYHAIGNMPVIRSVKINPRSKYVVTLFEETPKMQSYLLAFTVSKFDYIQSNDLDIPQKMYARRSRIINGDVNKIVVYLDKALKTFEEYFNVPYSLPKLDHFIGPDFYTAIENWGIIGYSERFILDDSMFSNIRTLLHEIAHQYFGNRVSSKWWSYVWLNEGLAKFYDTELLKFVMPEELDKIERHLQTTKFYAYIVDNQVSTNPLNHYVEGTEDIDKKFDNIIYHKAACIILMFQNVVGTETWKKGIKYYLEDNEDSAAEPKDLHKAVQKSLDEDFPENSLNIDKLMTHWEDHAGFPKISVTLKDGILKLSQKRDVDDENLQNVVYNIPITYATSESPNFDDFTTKFWMTEKEMELKDFTADWIILNNQQSGYYKIDYDENLWNRIIEQLYKDHSVIHHINREWLFNSRLYRLNAEDHDKSLTLRLLSYLKHEDNVNVLISMQTLLRKFLEANPNDEVIKTKLKDILEVVYQKTKGQENINTIKLMSHNLRVQIAIDDSINEMMRTLGQSNKNAKSIYCYGLVYANETIFDKVMDTLRRMKDPELVRAMIYGFGCVEVLELYKKGLNLLIERGKEDPEAHFYSWIVNLDSHDKVDVFLTFLEENFEELKEKSLDVLTFFLSTDISTVLSENQTDRLRIMKDRLDG